MQYVNAGWQDEFSRHRAGRAVIPVLAALAVPVFISSSGVSVSAIWSVTNSDSGTAACVAGLGDP